MSMIIKNKLDSIRFLAEEASINTDAWGKMVSSIDEYICTVECMPESPDKDRYKYELVDIVSRDMLMSFVFSLSNSKSQIITGIRSNLTTIDKKWTGPEDEMIAGSLIEMSRVDIVNILDKQPFNNIIATIVSLRHYFERNGIYPYISSIKEYPFQLQQFLSQGTLMDTNEHNNGCFFDEKVFEKIHGEHCNYVMLLLPVVTNYFVSVFNGLKTSNYNDNVKSHVVAGINNVTKELTYYLYQTLTKGQNIIAINTNTSYCDNPTYQAMRPITDVMMRIFLYGHILNSDRFANTKTVPMIWDTLELRRVVDNVNIIRW